MTLSGKSCNGINSKGFTAEIFGSGVDDVCFDDGIPVKLDITSDHTPWLPYVRAQIDGSDRIGGPR